jgi:hypothetical protein
MQLLEHAKDASLKSVLLITADRKEDWWWREQGKTIGAHPELVSEIRRYSAVELFWMYSSVQFLEHANTYMEANVSIQAVKELRQVVVSPRATLDHHDPVSRYIMVGKTTPQAIEDSKRSDRLSTGEEALLLALNGSVDGLAEDRLVQLSGMSQTRATVYLRKLKAEGYLRMRYTPCQQISEWVLCEPGENYLVHHDLVA